MFHCQVTSRNDQAQYWANSSKPYVFISVPEIAEAFKNSRFGRSLQSSISVPYDKSKSDSSALSKTKYAASKIEIFKACFERELLLISRHRFLYIFRTCQVWFTLSLLYLNVSLIVYKCSASSPINGNNSHVFDLLKHLNVYYPLALAVNHLMNILLTFRVGMNLVGCNFSFLCEIL